MTDTKNASEDKLVGSHVTMSDKPRPKITVAIVGTAGGSKDKNSEKLSKELFQKMRTHSVHAIDNIVRANACTRNDIELYSGGAAWSDHVAVAIAPYYHWLHVYFPCVFDHKANRHVDSGLSHWRDNPGKLSNSLHDKFSEIMGYDTQTDFTTTLTLNSKHELVRVPVKNVTLYSPTVKKNESPFHTRNSYIAKAQYLISFTFSDDPFIYKGGTIDTWNKCKGHKMWVNINTL